MSAVAPIGRFRELDSLRGIAALWVVVFHYTFGVGYSWLKDAPELVSSVTPSSLNLQGLVAVDLFFVISGFVIFMTVQRCRAVSDFVVSRFARLYPVFWVSATLTFFVAFLWPLTVQNLSAAQLAVNFTMLHLYIGVPSIEAVYWSLAVEFGFYAMIAVIFKARLVDRIETIGLVWVSGSFVLEKIFPQWGAMLPWRVETALCLKYSGLFFAGIVFFKIWSDRLTGKRCLLILFCYISITAFEDPLKITLETSIFVLVAVAISGKASALRWPPLVFLGTISYPLYLSHASIGFRVQRLLGSLGLPPTANLLLSTAFALALATLLTFAVERPANRFIRRRYGDAGGHLGQAGPRVQGARSP